MPDTADAILRAVEAMSRLEMAMAGVPVPPLRPIDPRFLPPATFQCGRCLHVHILSPEPTP